MNATTGPSHSSDHHDSGESAFGEPTAKDAQLGPELSPVLLELLRCPKPHHAPLSYDRSEGHLTCSQCGDVFRVEDGIPVMLVDEELEK